MVNHRFLQSSLLAAFALVFSLAPASISLAADEKDKEKSTALPIADLKRTDTVDFQKEILPILKRSCTACHNATDHKGDLVLETPASILKGGESGPAVVAGKSGESLLLKVAAHQAKPVMPPKNNKANAPNLKPEELGLIRLWIDQGAKGQVVIQQVPITWQPLPPGLNPIYAIAVTQDGQFLAAARANQIFIYHLPSKTLVTRLTDPNLLKSGFAKGPGIAERDIVQSLAFSPDGMLLASGGYRTVKLWRRPGAAKLAEMGAGLPVTDLAASPDGKWIATVAPGNAIKLWNAGDGKHAKDLTGHGGAVTDLKFSADSAKLLTGSADKSVRIWTIADGKQIAQLDTPGEVSAVTWLAKDAKIATGHNDGHVRIWNAGDAKLPAPAGGAVKPAAEIKQHNGPVTAMATVPTADTQFVTGSQDGNVAHIDGEKGKAIRTMSHGAPVTGVAVRPDGQRFASAGGASAKLWKADNGSPAGELKGSPQGTFLAEEKARLAALQDQHVAYYKKLITDTEARKKSEGEAVNKSKEAAKKAEDELKTKDDAFKKAQSEKDKADKPLAEVMPLLAKAMEDQKAVAALVDPAKAEAKAAQAKATESDTAAKNAEKAKSAADEAVKAADAKVKSQEAKVDPARKAAEKDAKDKAAADALKAVQDELAKRQATLKQAQDAAAAAAKALEPLAAAKAAAAKTFADLDAKRAEAEKKKADADKLVTDLTNKKNAAEQAVKAQEKPFTDAKNAFEAAARNKDSSANAVIAAMNSLKKSEEALAAAQAESKATEAAQKNAADEAAAAKKAATEPGKPVVAITFSVEGKTVVTGDEAGAVQTWNSEDGAPADVIPAHAGAVFAVATLPNGAIITGSADQKAITWGRGGDWTLERVIGSGESDSPLVDRVISLAFSTDGKMLATGGGNPSRTGEVKIWNPADGAMIRELKDPHSDTVFGVEFSHDGKHLATCAADKFVKTWTVADGKFVMSFEGHTHHVLGVSWMADGRTLMSAGADGKLKTWDFVAGGQKKTTDGSPKEVTAIRFIGVGDSAVVAAGDGQVKQVKQDGGSVRTFPGATDAIYCAAATPDGKIIVAGGQGSIVHVWNGTSGAEIAKFEPPQVEKTAAK